MARTLTVNQRLAAGALALGAVALLSRPLPGGVVTLDATELAAIVQTEVDHVAAPELADWIVQARTDFRLIDLRDAPAYAEYHIPQAERVPITGLDRAALDRTETLVLYSDGGIHAAQAWFLLKARGFRSVYTLRGGFEAWQDEVLFPELAPNPTPFQARQNERRIALAQHFGGQPMAAGQAATGPRRPLPAVAAPAGPLTPPTGGRKKKKEGC
jgi:rhodanese-related sulfurtransferase